MLENKDYCDYETCVALKELGYKGISRLFYATKESPLRRYSYDQILTTRIADAAGHTLAISLYVAQKWLREEKDIHIEIPIWLTDDGVWKYNFRLQTREFYDRAIGEWSSYEEALSEGIKEAVKLLKKE